jgi:hypothetical protein
MMTATSKTGTFLRRLTALVVAVWLTGAGCLLCCGETAHPAGANHAATVTTSKSAVPSAAAAQRPPVTRPAMESDHACCKAKVPARAAEARAARDAERTLGTAGATDSTAASDMVDGATERSGFVAFPERPSRARGCCERESQTLDAARKPRREAAPQRVLKAPAGDFAAEAATARAFAPAPDCRTRLPDRSDTRLRACVFLI